MAIVSSREDLIQYCYRQLGSPIVEINVDDTQADDCINLALEFYYEFHIEALERIFYPYTITQTDLDKKYITLPDEIFNVVKLLQFDSTYTANLQYQAFITDILDQAKNGRVSNYAVTMSYYNTIRDIFSHEKTILYNKNTKRVRIETDWNRFKVGTILIFEVFQKVDPNDYPDMWSDKWLLQYTTQLFKKQFAQNTRKYSNISLPGGLILNSEQWFSEASAEIIRLEEQLRNTYEMPTSMMIG